MELYDSVGNKYSFVSVGCLELHNIFFEVYECDEVGYVWCHEDGLPNSFEQLLEDSVILIDLRSSTRKVEVRDSDFAELATKSLNELNF